LAVKHQHGITTLIKQGNAVSVPEIGSGVVLGLGASNARYAPVVNGDVVRAEFSKDPTPQSPKAFFAWFAHKIMDAADEGHEWLVGGFPCPISPDGSVMGPLSNVKGMKRNTFNVFERLEAVDPEVARLREQGFLIVNVNDGSLAAQAVAHDMGEGKYQSAAALIIGTGVGAGVVRRDPKQREIYRVDRQSFEIGHIIASRKPLRSIERTISGPALEESFGHDPRDLPIGHRAWTEVGNQAGQIAMTLALLNDVELVVPTGGVGAGASAKYKAHTKALLKAIRIEGNSLQRRKMPDVKFIKPELCDEFEMRGGVGVILDYLTREAAA
jgi:predicted NBD/HSP70 family sugar kinase